MKVLGIGKMVSNSGVAKNTPKPKLFNPVN